MDSDALSFEFVLKWLIEMHYQCALQYFRANYEVEVVTPEANMGDVVGDLNRRRGQYEGMDDRAGC